MKVYIAGPMTGFEKLNEQSFNSAQLWLEVKHGCRVYNPARLPPGWDYEDYMAVDFALLGRCEGIVFLPGWEKSPGAVREHAEAGRIGVRDMSHLLEPRMGYLRDMLERATPKPVGT